MKKMLLAVLLLGIVVVSGCVSGGGGAQNNAAAGGTNVQSAAGSASNSDYTLVTLEDWDDKDAIMDSEGNIIYRRLDSIYSRNPQTNEEHILVNKEDNLVVDSDHYWIFNRDEIVSYSHDGKKFVYLTPMLNQYKDDNGNWTVSVRNVNDKNTKKPYEFKCWDTKIIKWSPDDTKLSGTCANYNNNVKSTLWIIDANTGKELFKKVVYVEKDSDYWSPDGKKVVYADSADNRLYYLDVESGTAKKLLDEIVYAVVGWTKNNEIIFNAYNQAGGKSNFLFDVASGKKTEIPNAAYGYFIISPGRTEVAYGGITPNTNVVAGGTSFVRMYNFADGKTKTILEKTGDISNLLIPSSITWSDSGKKIAFMLFKSYSDKSPELNVYNTEDGSLKTINYVAKEGSIKPMWYKDKLYIIHFAPADSTEFVSGDTDYGTVTATFNGKPATVRYTDIKVGEIAEVSVTVTSKINNAGVYIKLEEPRNKNPYRLVDGPSEIDGRVYDNKVTAGWSKTYTWKISPDGNLTDMYAPIDIDVQFRDHNEDDERKVTFTIANPYIIK